MSDALSDARRSLREAVGGAVLEFQKLELALKHLVARARLELSFPANPDDLNQQLASADMKTMGLLAGDFFKRFLLALDPEQKDEWPDDERASKRAIFRFAMRMPKAEREAFHARLAGLVKERNQLIHTSLLTMKLDTVEGCLNEVARIDSVRERVKAENQLFRHLVQTFHNMALDYLRSPALEADCQGLPNE